MLKKINKPTLFWIDAHYSGGVTAGENTEHPCMEELRQIFNTPDLGHVILIDDARGFGPNPAYPNLDDVSDFIRSKRPNVDIDVKDDIIIITPK